MAKRVGNVVGLRYAPWFVHTFGVEYILSRSVFKPTGLMDDDSECFNYSAFLIYW